MYFFFQYFKIYFNNRNELIYKLSLIKLKIFKRSFIELK